MTVNELIAKTSLKASALPDGEREVKGVYMGDLLSWVMGRAVADDAWITIMSNSNIVAVATLADMACIILVEGVEPDDGVVELALQKSINILQSEQSAYKTALMLAEIL